jgi:drug/metabolite transporter (DMT)-like permease
MSAGDINPRPDKVARGVTLIITAVFMMSIQEALFKFFSDDMSLWQIFTLRGLLTLPLFVILAFYLGQQRTMWSGAVQKWPLLRSAFMTAQFIATYAAIPFLSLSTVAAGVYTAPLFVTLLSAYAIGEPVGRRGWFAIALGFAGVLVILQPGTDAFTLWTILPVLGGFFYALTNVTTRAKCQNVPLVAIALSLNLALLFAGAVLSAVMFIWQPAGELVSATPSPYLFGNWSAVSPLVWAMVAVLAALVVAIQIALAGAYLSAPPAIIATFDYSYLVFVAIWDYLIFSTAPNAATIIGILLIITAGFLVIRRR